MKYWSHINSALQILSAFDGSEPFAAFLKKYFKQNKKYGSRDRKSISHLCYCFFRAGHLLDEKPSETSLLAAAYLCATEPSELLQQLKPEWNKKSNEPLSTKVEDLQLKKNTSSLFPWADKLSAGIDAIAFAESLLLQPNMFVRIRPGKESIVKQKLRSVSFDEPFPGCLSLPNGTRLEELVEPNSEVVVQDISSQRTGKLMELALRSFDHAPTVWDCCAASGGKSILCFDIHPAIKLTVSDIRESILINLRKRFEQAAIINYRSLLADLRTSVPATIGHFDFIIADLPCTGSGTWGRTPEQLYYFKKEKIEEYAALQKSIARQVASRLKPGGYFLYITCSVFKQENEETVDYIHKMTSLEIVHASPIRGYDKRADTLFAALFRKIS